MCVRGIKGVQSVCGTWTIIREGAFGTIADAPGGYSFNWRVCRAGVINFSEGKTTRTTLAVEQKAHLHIPLFKEGGPATAASLLGVMALRHSI
jgi:hypothetical protein